MLPSPRTTVTIPSFDADATLRDAVDSALAQTVPDFEVVIVDDGSRVDVTELLDDVRDPRIRIIRHERNRGVAAARNTALAAARAPLISQLDADDAWEPHYLESVLPEFADETVGLAYANAAVRGNPEFDVYINDPSCHPVKGVRDLALGNSIPSTTVTMRTDAVRRAHGFPRWLPVAEEYYLYLNLAAAGWRFAYVDRTLATYRAPNAERGMSFDERRLDRANLKLWAAFALGHPLAPVPWRTVCWRLMRTNARHLPGLDRLRKPVTLVG
jgi:glycosyltransferase involved in cell wall biosynthesis